MNENSADRGPFGLDPDKGEYSWNLDIQLETTIDSYEKDREIYWEKGLSKTASALTPYLYQQAEKFAEIIIDDTDQLFSIEGLPEDLKNIRHKLDEEYYKHLDDEAKKTFNSLSKEEIYPFIYEFLQENTPNMREIVLERFVISLAWKATKKIREGAERILQLYELVLKIRPAETTMSFLGRLSRCYIWGFDPECVILCRSVLDTAFREKISDDLCRKCLHIPEEKNLSLANRIKTAFKEGLIDKETKEIAYTVTERGNTAVHKQPDITKQVWETIRDTIKVLEKLHG